MRTPQWIRVGHLVGRLSSAAFGVLAFLSVPNMSQAQPATSAVPTGKRARITGIVTDLNTKQPIPSANVLLVGTPITATT